MLFCFYLVDLFNFSSCFWFGEVTHRLFLKYTVKIGVWRFSSSNSNCQSYSHQTLVVKIAFIKLQLQKLFSLHSNCQSCSRETQVLKVFQFKEKSSLNRFETLISHLQQQQEPILSECISYTGTIFAFSYFNSSVQLIDSYFWFMKLFETQTLS